MKAILSYGTYFNYGKNYQIKFIYDNELEAQYIISYLKPLASRKLIKPIYNNQETIDKTNIQKKILIPFINMLFGINNCKVIIGSEEFTSFNLNTIQEAIDKLHINATLNKGNFLVLEDTYYLTFKYASEEQKDELLYYFNCKLNYLNVYPISINKSGKLTSQNNGPIIGTNIPKEKISEFIKTFIEKYDMIITIGNIKLKDNFDKEVLNEAISFLDKTEKGKSRKRTMQGTH